MHRLRSCFGMVQIRSDQMPAPFLLDLELYAFSPQPHPQKLRHPLKKRARAPDAPFVASDTQQTHRKMAAMTTSMMTLRVSAKAPVKASNKVRLATARAAPIAECWATAPAFCDSSLSAASEGDADEPREARCDRFRRVRAPGDDPSLSFERCSHRFAAYSRRSSPAAPPCVAHPLPSSSQKPRR